MACKHNTRFISNLYISATQVWLSVACKEASICLLQRLYKAVQQRYTDMCNSNLQTPLVFQADDSSHHWACLEKTKHEKQQVSRDTRQ